MSNTDYIAQAKACIEKGDGYYKEAAEHIDKAHAEGATWSAISRELGYSRKWVADLVEWATKCEDTRSPTPWRSAEENQARYERQANTVLKDPRHAATILKDPERRQSAMAELPPREIEALITEANEVVIGRLRAKRAEHVEAEATIGELTGGESWDPSESWADTLIIRTNRNAHELAAQVAKWGLVFGTMPVDEAYEYLQETERLIAEVRVAAQSQVRDDARVPR